MFNATAVATYILIYVAAKHGQLMQRKHASRLQTCEMMCLQMIEGVRRRDRVKNEDICESLGQLSGGGGHD